MQSSEFDLDDGVEFQSYFTENQAKIFDFVIPAMLPDDAHLTIIAAPQRGTTRDFFLSVVSDEDDEENAPSTGFMSRKGIPAWKKGQVITLSKDTFPEGWCPGCTLKILVDVYDAGYYNIMAKTEFSDPLVFNNNQIDDVVAYGVSQCYRFYTKGNDTNLQVQLQTFSGSIELRANPEFIPENWNDFAIQTDNDYETILDITQAKRSELNLLQGLYYICVKGDLTSTYTVKFREFVPDLAHSLIFDGYSEYF